MEITILKPDENIITLNVNPSGTVEDLKVLMQFETGVPHQLQKLLFDGNEMRNSKKLRTYGVNDGDLVVMRMADSSVSSPRISNNELGFNPDGSAVNPSAFRQHILNDYDMMPRIYIEAANPHNGEIPEWKGYLEDIPRYTQYEKSPRVAVEVNGIRVNALLDTGAELSVMTKYCAEHCGLINTSDKETIDGVGQMETLGRINIAPIKIGSMYCLGSFVVVEKFPSCLFGMDIIRKNQCIIDTKANVLRIQGSDDVPFLQGSESEDSNVSSSHYSSGSSQRLEFKAKVSKLVELGFAKEAARNALKVFEGDEELAAEFLFGC